LAIQAQQKNVGMKRLHTRHGGTKRIRVLAVVWRWGGLPPGQWYFYTQ